MKVRDLLRELRKHDPNAPLVVVIDAEGYIQEVDYTLTAKPDYITGNPNIYVTEKRIVRT